MEDRVCAVFLLECFPNPGYVSSWRILTQRFPHKIVVMIHKKYSERRSKKSERESDFDPFSNNAFLYEKKQQRAHDDTTGKTGCIQGTKVFKSDFGHVFSMEVFIWKKFIIRLIFINVVRCGYMTFTMCTRLQQPEKDEGFFLRVCEWKSGYYITLSDITLVSGYTYILIVTRITATTW